MKNTKVLVTAATGKTGSHVVEQLIEKGYPVRAQVRRHSEKSELLESMGAEVVVGDYFDRQFLHTAMRGIKRAYFCYPPADRLLEAITNFAVVAKEVGLEFMVNMSQIIARHGHPSRLTNQHWLGERVLEWAGIGTAHIRPTLFAEMFLMLNAEGIASQGKIFLPYGKGSHAPVAAQDIARVVVGILTNPESHVGKAYTVTGEKALSQNEIARIIGDVLGKPVEYVDIPLEKWRQAMADKGHPTFLIDHLSCVAEDYQVGRFDKVTDVVLKVGGQPAQNFEAFISENIAVLDDRIAEVVS
ncbi:MAG: NmrA family NAD(P)-binding protein [Nitrospina sp.]|jgi:NAD(P)H dehydrogenase (quinone)|nr:NmrA family NAD(P)-binding protein [Nitrospina sp.]MBT5550414.1 NmrA family NAD(P)-binding protein [Nitrospina sp.]